MNGQLLCCDPFIYPPSDSTKARTPHATPHNTHVYKDIYTQISIHHIDGLVQDCGNSSALAMDLL